MNWNVDSNQSSQNQQPQQTQQVQQTTAAPWMSQEKAASSSMPRYNQQQQQTQQQTQQQQKELDPELLQMLHGLNSELQETKNQNQQYGQTIEKLKSAFGGADEPKEDPSSWYDAILTKAFELEKAGQPIPVTVQLANQLHQLQQQHTPLIDEIKQLKQQINILKNPEVQHAQIGYTKFDNILEDMFNSSFSEPNHEHKDAVSRMVAKEIQRIQKEDPKTYSQLLRDDSMKQKMVKYYFEKSIPDSYRKLAEDDYLKNSPMTKDEIVQALQAAKQIKDPALRSKVMAEARAAMWEFGTIEKKQNSWQSKMKGSSLY